MNSSLFFSFFLRLERWRKENREMTFLYVNVLNVKVKQERGSSVAYKKRVLITKNYALRIMFLRWENPLWKEMSPRCVRRVHPGHWVSASKWPYKNIQKCIHKLFRFYSLARSLTQSLTQSLTHSLTHSHIHSITLSLTRSLCRSLNNSANSLIRSLTHSFICPAFILHLIGLEFADFPSRCWLFVLFRKRLPLILFLPACILLFISFI